MALHGGQGALAAAALGLGVGGRRMDVGQIPEPGHGDVGLVVVLLEEQPLEHLGPGERGGGQVLGPVGEVADERVGLGVAPAAAHPFTVRLIAFVVGAASLGTEIAAARLLAPYFGASTIIWANTIATVLVALSAGYAIGGRLADRRADLRGLCLVVLVASVLLALVPFVSDPFLRLSVNALGALSVGGFLGSLAAVLVLVAVPVLLLGTVAPYANRLALGRVGETGTVTGGLYAISTAGSLVGTFASALLLIPVIGTHRTFLVFAIALVALAAPRLGAGA